MTRAGNFRRAKWERGWVLSYAIARRSRNRSRQLSFTPTGEGGLETASAEGRNAGRRLPGPAGHGFWSHRRAPSSGRASISSRAGGAARPSRLQSLAGLSRGTAGGLSSAHAHRGQRPPEARMRTPPVVGVTASGTHASPLLAAGGKRTERGRGEVLGTLQASRELPGDAARPPLPPPAAPPRAPPLL